MSNDIKIKEITNTLNSNEFVFLCQIIKKENTDSILASLSESLIKQYFQILINSKNIYLYICKKNNKDVGYVIFSRKPSFLIDEFKQLKYSIAMNLIINFEIKAILNILLSLFKLDLIFLSKTKKNFINSNFNLNLLAIERKFQSQGIGKRFINKVIENLREKDNFNLITVETNNERTADFYEKKLDFYYVGKKIRLFKNLKIFKKDLK